MNIIQLRARVAAKIFGIAVALLLSFFLLGNSSGQDTRDQKIKSEAENENWWAERAAAFFPKYQLTLKPTGLRLASGDNGKISVPDAILADRSWTGATNTTWSTPTNWSGGLPGGTDNAVFNSTFTNQPNLTASATVGGLWMTGAVGQNVTISLSAGTALSLNGNTINGTAGLGILVDNANAFTLTISAPVTLGNAQTWRNNSANLLSITNTVTGLNTNAKALTIDGTGDFLISAKIIGSGAITLAGTGNTVTFSSAASTYTGQLTVQSGTLKIGTINNNNTDGVLGHSTGAVILGGTGEGTLEYTGATASSTKKFTMGTSASGIGNFQIDSAGTTLTLSGAIDGLGSIRKTGAGTLVLDPNVTTYAGSLTIDDGILAAAGTTANYFGTANSAININAGTLRYDETYNGATRNTIVLGSASSTIDVSGSNSYTPGVVSGSGSLTKAGTGTLTLSSANTYVGSTSVNAGVLNIQNNTALGTTAAGTSVTGTAALQLQGGITVGAEALSLNSTSATGALRNISGDNIWQGAVTLAGTTRINSDAGSLTLSAANSITGTNQNLTLGGAGDGTVSGTITTGSGTLTKDGAGTWTLSGANTYSGATTINAGTLSINSIANVSGGSSALGTPTTAANGTIKIGSGSTGATLQYTGSGHTSDRVIDLAGTTGGATLDASGTGALVLTSDFTATGVGDKTLTLTGSSTAANTIQGKIVDNSGSNTTSVTKSGTGSWVLSGASTYTGATAINAGVLRAANSNALGMIAGGVTISAGAALELDGTASALTIGAEALTLNGTGIGNGGALRNIAGNNSWAGVITLADVAAVHRINSDSGTLTIGAGGITETGGSLKDLTFGGAGDVMVNGIISSPGNDMRVFKDGAGTLTLTAANTYVQTTAVTGGTMVLSGANGAIVSSTGITIGGGATLRLDNTSNINLNRIGNVTITMQGGTFDFAHGTTLGNDYTETTGQLSLSSGASTIRTDVSNTGASSSSILTFDSLARTAGATVNFGGGTGNPSAANDDNNVRFTTAPTLSNGIIGPWATVGGTSFATYNSAGSTDSVEALASYNQTVTRLSSGTKSIASSSTQNVQIIDGTGTAANITLGAATTTINTLTNSAPGTTSPAGGVTIDPAGQALRVGGILNASGSSALTIGNGTNNGTLANASGGTGGELTLHNYSSNDLTVNSVIANNGTASRLTTSGTGRTILTAVNTYSGATTVNAGTLLVNGSLASGSAVTVNGSGTVLGGTGTINGAVTVNANAILQGGDGTTGATQKLTLSGNLTLADNSIIQLALGPSGAHSTLARTGGTWTFDSNQAFSLIDLGATGTYQDIITGVFNPTSQSSWTITNDGWMGTFTWDGVGPGLGNIDLTLTAVPEPSTWIGGALTLGILGWTQRRRLARVVRRVA